MQLLSHFVCGAGPGTGCNYAAMGGSSPHSANTSPADSGEISAAATLTYTALCENVVALIYPRLNGSPNVQQSLDQ